MSSTGAANKHGYLNGVVPLSGCTHLWLLYLIAVCLSIWVACRFASWIKDTQHPPVTCPLAVTTAPAKSYHSHFSKSGQSPYVMDKDTRSISAGQERAEGEEAQLPTNAAIGDRHGTLTAQHSDETAERPKHRPVMSRPPPAPPLTPPGHATHFPLNRFPRSDRGMMYEDNPDYADAANSTGGFGSTTSQEAAESSPQPRRRSYNKTMPIGIPEPHATHVNTADLAFTPKSSSPVQPPLSPSTAVASQQQSKEVEVQSEIISVQDEDGSVWTRHTRVYGGGPCLACEAVGREHHAGGFYGANVLPEEMHWRR